MHYKLWCQDCMKFVSAVLTDTQVVKQINQLTTDHAFSPAHKQQTRLRIASGRLMKEIKAINDGLDGFGL